MHVVRPVMVCHVPRGMGHVSGLILVFSLLFQTTFCGIQYNIEYGYTQVDDFFLSQYFYLKVTYFDLNVLHGRVNWTISYLELWELDLELCLKS